MSLRRVLRLRLVDPGSNVLYAPTQHRRPSTRRWHSTNVATATWGQTISGPLEWSGEVSILGSQAPENGTRRLAKVYLKKPSDLRGFGLPSLCSS